MLRRHGSLILAMTLIVLVATACLVRTGPGHRHRGPAPVYRSDPDGDHRDGKHKKPKKHKEDKKHLHAPYENAPRDHR